MNERILELNAQADKYAWEKVGKKYDGAGDLNWRWEDTKMEKFAELIVKECIGCCEQVISDPVPESVDTWLNGGSQCIEEIKEHFGVEE